MWWVTRRLYGNLGGYTALALYCFSPAVLKACVAPNPEVLAALGVYGGVYTCIGVAHAMQGPRRKWRPRIVLLTVLFGVAAASHIAALPVVALLGFVLMLWVAEGHRSQVLPVVLIATAGALVLLFVCYGFSPDAFSYVFRSAAGFLWFSLDPARRFFSTLGNAGITVAAAAALLLYLGLRRSRYFGNTTPLLCACVLFLLVMTGTPGSSVAVGAAVSAHVYRRSVRRCLRKPARTAGAGRRRRHRAAAGGLLPAESARASVADRAEPQKSASKSHPAAASRPKESSRNSPFQPEFSCAPHSLPKSPYKIIAK